MSEQRQHRNRLQAHERDYLAWYHSTKPSSGQPFDSTVFVQEARRQWSDHPQLADAFATCTRQWPRNDRYTYLIDRAYVQGGAHNQWFFAANLFLDHPTLGTLVVDVLYANAHRQGPYRIGGIEYLRPVMGGPTRSAGELKMMLLQSRAGTEARHAGN